MAGFRYVLELSDGEPADPLFFNWALRPQTSENDEFLAGRDLEAPLFPGLTDERIRTAITKPCKASGTPHFSPHGLRLVWLLMMGRSVRARRGRAACLDVRVHLAAG